MLKIRVRVFSTMYWMLRLRSCWEWCHEKLMENSECNYMNKANSLACEQCVQTLCLTFGYHCGWSSFFLSLSLRISSILRIRREFLVFFRLYNVVISELTSLPSLYTLCGSLTWTILQSSLNHANVNTPPKNFVISRLFVTYATPSFTLCLYTCCRRVILTYLIFFRLFWKDWASAIVLDPRRQLRFDLTGCSTS